MGIPSLVQPKRTILPSDSGYDSTDPDGSGIVPNAPSPPQMVAGDGQLSVYWSAVFGAAAYDVIYSTTNSTEGATAFSGNPVSGTSAVITGLENGTTYYVFVRATNEAGSSEYSNGASGVPAIPGAGPVISSVTGTIAQGEIVTISGSNFSTYRSSTMFFTDFSEGEIGSAVIDAINWLGGTAGAEPQNYLFSDDTPRTGGTIARANAVETSPGNLWAELGGLQECYVEFAHRKVKPVWGVEGEKSPQIKTARLVAGTRISDRPHIGITEQNTIDGAPKGRPTLVSTFEEGAGKSTIYYPSTADGDGIAYTEGEWYRDSLYMRVSDPDAANGEWWFRTSLRNQWYAGGIGVFQTPDAWSEPPSVTRTHTDPENLLERMFFPFYSRDHQTTIVDLDYIYINDSRERVMLSTSPVLTASVDYDHVCCPTISKTSGDIQTKLLLDALPPGVAVYAYVFNHDGTANQNGYLIREGQ